MNSPYIDPLHDHFSNVKIFRGSIDKKKILLVLLGAIFIIGLAIFLWVINSNDLWVGSRTVSVLCIAVILLIVIWRYSIRLEMGREYILHSSIFGKDYITVDDVYAFDWAFNAWKTPSSGGLCIFDRQLKPRVYIVPSHFFKDFNEIEGIIVELVKVNNPNFARWVVHGMYIGWIAEKAFFKQSKADSIADKTQAFKERKLTGFQAFGTKGIEIDSVIDEARQFNQYYWNSKKEMAKYRQVMMQRPENKLVIEDTWENYKKFSDLLNESYSNWLHQKK